MVRKKKTEVSEAAAALVRHRWAKIPKEQRSEMMPKTGGRPRIYPPCTLYKRHSFDETGACNCGFSKAPKST